LYDCRIGFGFFFLDFSVCIMYDWDSYILYYHRLRHSCVVRWLLWFIPLNTLQSHKNYERKRIRINLHFIFAMFTFNCLQYFSVSSLIIIIIIINSSRSAMFVWWDNFYFITCDWSFSSKVSRIFPIKDFIQGFQVAVLKYWQVVSSCFSSIFLSFSFSMAITSYSTTTTTTNEQTNDRLRANERPNERRYLFLGTWKRNHFIHSYYRSSIPFVLNFGCTNSSIEPFKWVSGVRGWMSKCQLRHLTFELSFILSRQDSVSCIFTANDSWHWVVVGIAAFRQPRLSHLHAIG